MDDDSYNNKFTGEQTIHFGSAALTLPMLERVFEIANKHGKVAIIGIAPSSVVYLLLDLLDAAEKLKEARKLKSEALFCPSCGSAMSVLPQRPPEWGIARVLPNDENSLLAGKHYKCAFCQTWFYLEAVGGPAVERAQHASD